MRKKLRLQTLINSNALSKRFVFHCNCSGDQEFFTKEKKKCENAKAQNFAYAFLAETLDKFEVKGGSGIYQFLNEF